MKLFIAKNFLGVFALDGNGKIIEYRSFPKEPEKIAEKLSEECEEEKELEASLKSRYKDIELAKDSENKKMNKDYRKLALELKWVKSDSEFNEILAKTNIILTKNKLKLEKKDKILMQAVTTLEEIEKDINVFSEKLREWYGLHFPELTREVGSNEKLAEIISIYGKRENIEDNNFSNLAKKSAGMEFSENDIIAVRSFSIAIKTLFTIKKTITGYIEKEAKEAIPNLAAVAGPILACKLISLAGGLEKIAKMPSSTIQLLGSEKALFRHLRGEGKAPKYGVLFGHPYVQQAPQELKGKVARHVAAKLSLAAKVDYFSKEDRGEKLRKELEEQVKDVLGKNNS